MIDPEPSYVEDSFECIYLVFDWFWFRTRRPKDRPQRDVAVLRRSNSNRTSIQNFETKKALHENKDDDGFGPTIKKAAKNPDGTEKDKWRTTGGATFEDNIQVRFIRIFFSDPRVLG